MMASVPEIGESYMTTYNAMESFYYKTIAVSVGLWSSFYLELCIGLAVPRWGVTKRRGPPSSEPKIVNVHVLK